MTGININDDWESDPEKIKEAGFESFSNRFKKTEGCRTKYWSSSFTKLSEDDNNSLCCTFEKEEIKQAVDFKKAFDCVCWDFLNDVMDLMNFSPKWRKWIFGCLSSGRSSVLIRGSPTKEFSLEKGLRQGDPLSPFLFLIVCEALSVMLNDATRLGFYMGVSVGKDAVHLSHLQIADDVLFFGDWSRGNIANLMDIISWFGMASELRINWSKSNFFSLGIPQSAISDVAHAYNCSAGTLPFVYLGLPVGRNMNKISSWDVIINKFMGKLIPWKAKLLSIGGRLTLIKSVLTNIPLYFMSLFRAPTNVINKLEAIRSIGSLKVKNLNLLAKWWWHLKREKDVLWAKIIKSIYGSNGGLSDNSIACSSSIWNSVVKSGSVIDKAGVPFTTSIICKLENGQNTMFWHDVWIPDSLQPLKDLFPRLYALDSDRGVSVANRTVNATDGLKGNWNWRNNIRGRTHDELANLDDILALCSSTSTNDDCWSWRLSSKGIFKVHILSALIDNELMGCDSRPIIVYSWPTCIPQKINIFAWRLLHNALATRTNLEKRGVTITSSQCPFCDGNQEVIDHIFVDCKFIVPLWRNVISWWQIKDSIPNGLNNAMSVASYRFDSGNASIFFLRQGSFSCG
ncbi:uncharacterized protein [Rutidosis leptorrhynchoides]|uniref:uncharacterized protein n=1 Tax=Rutidosis leptorrhynchoides TaxID=125765 RepID=UPI003A98D266